MIKSYKIRKVQDAKWYRIMNVSYIRIYHARLLRQAFEATGHDSNLKLLTEKQQKSIPSKHLLEQTQSIKCIVLHVFIVFRNNKCSASRNLFLLYTSHIHSTHCIICIIVVWRSNLPVHIAGWALSCTTWFFDIKDYVVHTFLPIIMVHGSLQEKDISYIYIADLGLFRWTIDDKTECRD